MNITRFSIKRPIGICMIYILVCVLGLISFFRIGVELLPDVIEAGGVRMDVERHEVWVDGQGVKLALKEFELLEMLLRNAGRVMTRGQLIDRIWGADYVGDTKTLDVHVKRLRGKIEDDPAHPRLLVTVRGLGYKFDG